MTHKALDEIVAAPGFKAEVERARRKLDAEEAGWAVMEPRKAQALRAVAWAARIAADDYEEEPYGLHRALERLEKLRGES